MELEQFEYELAVLGRNDRTIKNLVQCLRPIKEFSQEEVKNRIYELIKDKKFSHAHKTVNAARAYGTIFGFSWAESIKYPSVTRKAIRDVPTTSELKLLLECPQSGRTKNWNKFSVMFAISALTGARLGEVAKLRQSDISWGTGFIYFYETKTGQSRKAPIAKSLESVLKPYCSEIKVWRINWLFFEVEILSRLSSPFNRPDDRISKRRGWF